MSKIFIGLKKTCLGVLDRGDRDNDNETGSKEGGGIEIETTVLSIYAMHALLRFCIYLPLIKYWIDILSLVLSCTNEAS